MKECTKCKENKREIDFAKDARRQDGLQCWCRQCCKDYRTKHGEKTRQIDRDNYANDKTYSKQYWQSRRGRFVKYKIGARARGYDFCLTEEQFQSLWGKDCWYCGERIIGIGIDRVDNSIGYTVENCVPCCYSCNRAKMTKDGKDFIRMCEKVYLNTLDKISDTR